MGEQMGIRMINMSEEINTVKSSMYFNGTLQRRVDV